MTVVYLNHVAFSCQISRLSQTNILSTGVLGKSPLQTLKDLLASSKLELSTTDSLNNMWLTGILCADGEKDLSNVNTGGYTNGLTVRVTHTRREPIGSGTRKHLIGTDNVVGVDTDTDVVTILSNSVGQVLVNGNTAGLKCLGGDLLLLVTDQVGNEGEEIDGSLLGSNIVNPDFGFGYTTAVA